MVWTDAIKVIKTGIAFESTPGTAETQPMEYTYINNDGVLNAPRDFDDFRAHSSRCLTFSVAKAYHITANFGAWVFPDTNGFGYWLTGALGLDGTPTKHGTLSYIHSITATDTQIPSFTLWMKTGVYEYLGTNCQVNRLTINQAKNSVLTTTAEFFGSQISNTATFGSASYVTDANDAFTSQQAYMLWDDTLMTNISDVTFTIDNGIDPNEPKIMGKSYADHILAGNRSITGSGTIFVESTAELEDYWGAATGPAAQTTTIPLRIFWISDDIEDVNTQTAAVVDLQTGTSTPTISGTYSGADYAFFEIKITSNAADKFKWRKNWGAWSSEVAISDTAAKDLTEGMKVAFDSTTTSALNDRWFFWVGDRPYCLDIHMPSCRITQFEQQSVGNRLAARFAFTAMVSSTYAYDVKARLLNTKSTTYSA